MSSRSKTKKRITPATAWRDARELILAHRYRLALGLFLMLVNRLVGYCVLPASSKYLIDEVIIKQRGELLLTLALAAGAATLIQAVSSFMLSQVLGVAAQRAITEMRKSVQEHIARLPVHYFDSTQTGILISRIMTDAEGIRNLVGTGLVQLVGSLVTASIALCVLFYLNWSLTLITLVALGIFGACMALAFGVCDRSSANAARSTPKLPGGLPSRSAAFASSKLIRRRNARSSSLRAERIGCFATWRVR